VDLFRHAGNLRDLEKSARHQYPRQHRNQHGGASTPGGRAGNASDSGQFSASLNLSALVEAIPGRAATRPFTPGGVRGNPTSYQHVSCSSNGCSSICKSSSFGASATGPAALEPTGWSKAPKVLGKSWSWMTPQLLDQMLRYAKEAYLYGHYQ